MILSENPACNEMQRNE